MLRTLILYFLLLPLLGWGSSELDLNGFIGEETCLIAEKILAQTPPSSPLFIKINSTSGDLKPVLDLARAIYTAKKTKQIHVIVYIEDKAIGPGAIFPFLSDELYTSLVVSWGDIPAGAERALPANQLKSRVVSFIDKKSPHAPLLFLLAEAMSDPRVQIDYKGEWKQVIDLKSDEGNQTLVVNQEQISKLGIANGNLSVEEFAKKFHLQEEKEPGSLLPLQQKLEKSLPFNKEGPNRIGYLYIGDHEDSISESTWLYMKQGLDYYKKNPPLFIVLELNTPGGEVFAAQKISDALKEIDTQYDIPVVTFINNWAISAGAMLAYSSRFITTVKDGSMGAAEPVMAGEGGGLQTASEKINSALRTDFASRARFFDRNPL
ncbi:MAG: serine protease, partial [Parachlamydia sp.]|nr:serine protease [Parachlamydia sp.]